MPIIVYYMLFISRLPVTKTSVYNLSGGLVNVEQTRDKSKQICAVITVDELQIGGKEDTQCPHCPFINLPLMAR